jgi:hypothetical protein
MLCECYVLLCLLLFLVVCFMYTLIAYLFKVACLGVVQHVSIPQARAQQVLWR